jgi:hypothetical protein
MKIKQYVICPSINFFEHKFKDRWNLVKYNSHNEPLFFFGFSGVREIYEKHHGYKIIWMSTPTDLPDFKNLKNTNNTILIYDCPLPDNYYLPENVILRQEVLEIKDYSMFKPSVLGDKIYYYSGFSNGWTPNPKTKIDYIQSKVDYEIITTQHINKSDMYDIEFLIKNYYNKCFLNLNFSKGHGMTTTREFSLMGIKTLTFNNPYQYKCLIKCKDMDEVIENIKIESKKINTIQPVINPHTVGSEWLELNYLLKNKID